MKVKALALTTNDNPYNPFTEWDAWYGFDLAHGYNTCSYLARSVFDSESCSELESIQSTNKAVEDIVRLNATGYWKKVETEIEL